MRSLIKNSYVKTPWLTSHLLVRNAKLPSCGQEHKKAHQKCIGSNWKNNLSHTKRTKLLKQT